MSYTNLCRWTTKVIGPTSIAVTVILDVATLVAAVLSQALKGFRDTRRAVRSPQSVVLAVQSASGEEAAGVTIAGAFDDADGPTPVVPETEIEVLDVTARSVQRHIGQLDRCRLEHARGFAT
jgi:hypothetical protein